MVQPFTFGSTTSLASNSRYHDGHGISFSLVIAFFLANLPEAVSSSTLMRKNGTSRMTISLMWFSLVGAVSLFVSSSLKSTPYSKKHSPNRNRRRDRKETDEVSTSARAPSKAWPMVLCWSCEFAFLPSILLVVANDDDDWSMVPEANHEGGAGLSVLCGYIVHFY